MGNDPYCGYNYRREARALLIYCEYNWRREARALLICCTVGISSINLVLKPTSTPPGGPNEADRVEFGLDLKSSKSEVLVSYIIAMY